MNKLVFSLALLFTATMSHIYAQCTPDAFAFLPVSPLTDTTIVNQPYSQTITISVPADTTVTFAGQSFTVSIIKMTVTPTPTAPFSTACDLASCTWNGGQKGCIQVSGTPTVVGTVSIPMNITVTFLDPITGLQQITQALPAPAPFNIEVVAGTNPIEDVIQRGFRFAACSPSPANSKTTLSYTSANVAEMSVSVYDLTGAVVKTATFLAKEGDNQYELNLAGIASGMYIVALNNGSNTLTQRLVVE